MSTHIGAKPGDVAPRILLPGDPLRAKYIAENFLENVKCFHEVRGMLGFTGTYNGVPVSVMGTGMGIPSIGIYCTELFKDYGVKTAMRIGTCGSFREELPLGAIILAEGACTNSDFNHLVFPGSYACIADFELLRAAYLKAKETDVPYAVGNIFSSDMFYAEADPKFAMWEKYGILGVEMEAAVLYTKAKKYDAKALCLVTVSDGKRDKDGNRKIMTSQEREQSLNSMITLALNTIIEF